MAKPNSKQQEALQLLDDLDNLSGSDLTSNTKLSRSSTTSDTNTGQAADVLAFIDEVTQKSSEPSKPSASRLTISRPSSRTSNTPSLRKKKSVELARSTSPFVNPSNNSAAVSTPQASAQAASVEPNQSASGWGWSSVWTGATAAIQQARTIVDDQVKTLQSHEQTRKLQEGVMGYVNASQLEKLGKDLRERSLSAFSDILNAVAPPISEHEVLRVWLTHDMQGYDGVESIVYQSLARVMQQVEGGDLVVNKGNESKPRSEGNKDVREMNLIDGMDAAAKLSQASIDDLIKFSPPVTAPEDPHNPTTYTSLYLRIQPFTLVASSPMSKQEGEESSLQVKFLIQLVEPSHQLSHATMTQAFPHAWLEAWNSNEWVEDLIVDSLRLGVQVVGQEYIISRMGLSTRTTKGKAQEEVSQETSKQ